MVLDGLQYVSPLTLYTLRGNVEYRINVTASTIAGEGGGGVTTATTDAGGEIRDILVTE